MSRQTDFHLEEASPGDAHPNPFADVTGQNGIPHMFGGHFGLDGIATFSGWGAG